MKHSNLPGFSLLLVAAGLTGCSIVPTQFGGSWPLPIERHSSHAIDLARPALWPKSEGRYVLIGYLVKQWGAATTANSHIDVKFLGTGGAVLLQKTVDFQPHELPRRVGRGQPHARYELELASLPPGTARIRVEAHDGTHAAL